MSDALEVHMPAVEFERLIDERLRLRAENEKLKPIATAAIAWRDTWRHRAPFGDEKLAVALVDAVDASVGVQPTIYPCGCSRHKVNLGMCDSYKPGERP